MTDTTQFDKQEAEKRSEATLIALREYPNAEEILQRHADAMNEWYDAKMEPPTLEKYADTLTMDYSVNKKTKFYAELLSDPKEQVEQALTLLEFMTAELEVYSQLLDDFRKKAAPFKNLYEDFKRAVPYDRWKQLTNGIWNQPKKYELALLYHLLQHVKDHKYSTKNVPPYELSDNEYTEIRERVIVDGEPQIAGVNDEFKKLLKKKRARKIVQRAEDVKLLTGHVDKMMSSQFEHYSTMGKGELYQSTLDKMLYEENIILPGKSKPVHIERRTNIVGENGEFVKVDDQYNYHYKRIIDAIGSIEENQPEELADKKGIITLNEVYRLLCHNPKAKLIPSTDEEDKKLIEEHNARVDSGELDKKERKYANEKEEKLLKDLRYLTTTFETIHNSAIAEGHDTEITTIKSLPMIPGTIERRTYKVNNRIYEDKYIFVPFYNPDGTIMLPPRYKQNMEQKNEKGRTPFLKGNGLNTSYEYLQSVGIITAGYVIEKKKGEKKYHLVESVSDWDYYPDLKSLMYERLALMKKRDLKILFFDDLIKYLFRIEKIVGIDEKGRPRYKREKKVLSEKELRKFKDAVKDIMSIFKAKNFVDDWNVHVPKKEVLGIIVDNIHLDQPEPTVKTKEELKQIWDKFVADLKYRNVELKDAPKKSY